jgi:phosphatidylserine/phosphatidylglycerophosphate/cardiolipin synthase-like enzyme
MNSKAYGKGNIVPYLRTEITKVKKELFIIGPWIDGFFIDEIINNLVDKSIHLKMLLRYEKEEPEIQENTLACIKELQSKIPNSEFRNSNTIHAKMILIDNSICLLGSANWYQYSLEQVEEIVLKLEISEIKNLEQITQSYWESGKKITMDAIPLPKKIAQEKNIPSPKSFDTEILDEKARKALKENSKAFIIGRKQN